MSLKYRFFVLTGDPGVGKTTLIQKINSIINKNGIKTVGFYTEEVRKGGSRQGFDVVSLDGRRGRLAVDQTLLTSPSKYKVGKYGVLVKDFEDVALPCLELPKNSSSCILIIDEIGKMEFFSEAFKSKIEEIFNKESEYLVIATIPVRRSDMIIENIRNDSRAKVWKVTRENRNTLHDEIVNEITKATQ